MKRTALGIQIHAVKLNLHYLWGRGEVDSAWKGHKYIGRYTWGVRMGHSSLFFRTSVNVQGFLVCRKYFIMKINLLIRMEYTANQRDLFSPIQRTE